MALEVKCSNCEYFEGVDFGICRRYPPKYNSYSRRADWGGEDAIDIFVACEFPKIDADDWCGEFKPGEVNNGQD